MCICTLCGNAYVKTRGGVCKSCKEFRVLIMKEAEEWVTGQFREFMKYVDMLYKESWFDNLCDSLDSRLPLYCGRPNF